MAWFRKKEKVEKELIVAKVAFIIPYNGIVVLNKGKLDGITSDMIFTIFESKIEIKDPITGEHLGTIHREKLYLNIWDLKEKITICKAYKQKMYIGGIHESLVEYRSFPNDLIEIGEEAEEN